MAEQKEHEIIAELKTHANADDVEEFIKSLMKIRGDDKRNFYLKNFKMKAKVLVWESQNGKAMNEILGNSSAYGEGVFKKYSKGF